jgi:hypothetical protein
MTRACRHWAASPGPRAVEDGEETRSPGGADFYLLILSRAIIAASISTSIRRAQAMTGLLGEGNSPMQQKPDVLTKVLAVGGALLSCFPILAPILLTAAFLIAEGAFRFDYLMPAELFPAALAGGLLLLWAAIRMRAQRRLIGWGLGLGAALLFGAQALAEISGLASGAEDVATLWRVAVFAALALYSAAIIAVAVGGFLLLKALFSPRQAAA